MANENMRLSAAGYRALRVNEGVVMHYYNDIANNCTWGIGTLAHFGPCTAEELRRPVTLAMANGELAVRVRTAEDAVKSVVRAHSLTQEQFDAAVSFAYNSRTSNIRDALAPANQGDMAAVARHFMRNVMIRPRDSHGHASGPARLSPGLVNRRARESRPFLQGSP